MPIFSRIFCILSSWFGSVAYGVISYSSKHFVASVITVGLKEASIPFLTTSASVKGVTAAVCSILATKFNLEIVFLTSKISASIAFILSRSPEEKA
jgi:hypothetical protein